MAESAFAVNVPEAEPYVGALRSALDPTAKLGVPAHITVLYPFMSPERITVAVLGQARTALSEINSFAFRLANVRRFPSALYLEPDPAEPFICLTQALVQRFPQYLPYGGQYRSIAPHLTIAQAGEKEHDEAQRQVAAALPPSGIQASCREVVLIENSSGRWRQMHTFPLPTANHLLQTNGQERPAAD